ncbi:MAG: Peptidase serralysin terminal, partial [Planctomycetota bacterium]
LGDSGSDTLNGDAGNDTMTGGSQNDTINGGASGVDVDTARFTGNLGTISGSATLSVTSSDSGEGTDTVSNVEIIDYANADVVIVGRAGSSIADLNTALSTYTGSQKFWGDLTINSSTNFSTSGEFAAIYARLVSGGSAIAVDMSGMSANQIAAVNANYATASASLTSAPIFIKRGGNDVGQAPTIQTAIDYATAGDTIEITAASYSQATTLSVSKNLTIARRGSIGTVTITDSSSGTGIASLVDISGSAVVSLSNLSFVGGSGTSSAQVINSGASASVTVTGCSITSCAGSDVNYGINAAGSVTVANSTLLAGDASRWVGVSMNNGGSVSGSTITGNAPLAPGSVKEHIGVSVVSGTVTITGGAITGCDNGASSFGVAVSGGTATLSGTDLSSNYYAVRATGGTVSAAGCNFTDSERVETTSDSNFTSNFWGTTVANDIAARAIGTIRFSPYSTTSAHSATAEGAVVLTGQGRSYSTIQAALDASATTSSSTVSVSAGNYNETPVIMDSGLTVSVATGAYSGSTGTDPLTFTLDGSLASATLADSGAANATGNTAANSITGNAGVNVLSGGDAADTLSGGAGADTLNGDAGNDSLVGGDGNDAINGGTGDDSMNGGAGDDTLNGGADASEVDTAVFTGDLGTITGSGPLSVTTSNSAADGTDSVANAEVLDFGDVEVVVVGRGSAFANLNAALASSVSTGRKFWGNLEINSSTVFSSAADFTAIYNRLVTSGSTFTINMTGMSQDQVNAVNASYSTVAGNINTTFGPITISRLVSSVSTVVGRAPTIERAIGFATIGDTVTLPEGEFDITSRLDLYRITLEGAGSGSIVGGAVSGGSISDYSGLTMAANDCAVKFLGDGSVLRNVAITARGR